MLLCPLHFSGKNTGVGCHFLLQRIFLTQESNPGLLHCIAPKLVEIRSWFLFHFLFYFCHTDSVFTASWGRLQIPLAWVIPSLSSTPWLLKSKLYLKSILILADNSYLPTAKNKLLQFCMSGGVPHFQNYVGWLSWRSAASHLLTVSPVHSPALFRLLWTVLPSNLKFGLQFQQRLLVLDGFREKKRGKVTQCHEVTLGGLG